MADDVNGRLDRIEVALQAVVAGCQQLSRAVMATDASVNVLTETVRELVNSLDSEEDSPMEDVIQALARIETGINQLVETADAATSRSQEITGIEVRGG